MKQNYIDLKMPSIMGMGAVGPTLSVLTASLYSALMVAFESPPHWAYPVVMLMLAALLAVFPVSKEKLPKWQKFVLWPIVSVIIFAAAWGTNHGLSLGEEALNGKSARWEMPSLIPSAYAQGTTLVVEAKSESKVVTNVVQVILKADLSQAKTNEVDFSTVNFKDKVKVEQKIFKEISPHVWGLDCPQKKLVFLRAKDGKWRAYRKHKKPVKIEEPKKSPVEQTHPPQQQQKLRGGFFKRWK